MQPNRLFFFPMTFGITILVKQKVGWSFHLEILSFFFLQPCSCTYNSANVSDGVWEMLPPNMTPWYFEYLKAEEVWENSGIRKVSLTSPHITLLPWNQEINPPGERHPPVLGGGRTFLSSEIVNWGSVELLPGNRLSSYFKNASFLNLKFQ